MTASPGRMRTSEKISEGHEPQHQQPCSIRRAMYVRIPIRATLTARTCRTSGAGALSVIQAVLASYEQYPGNQQYGFPPACTYDCVMR